MVPKNCLPSLPAEVWTLAWNMVCCRQDLKSLVLTCRLFRLICQELLFKEVRFSSTPHSTLLFLMLEFSTSENPASMRSEWQGHIERGARRIEGLSHHPVHRYSVKTVWFDGMENLDMSARSFPQEQAFEIQQTLMSSYLLALKSFTNLRHVGLGSSVIVNDELAHALSNLPNMDELLMHGPCSTSIASPMIAVKALTLSNVPSRGQDGVSGLELCSSQRMTSLTLHGIRHPEILLYHELAQREVNFLTHMVLHVRTTQLTAVFYFLPSCRNLESIGLYPSSDNGHIPLKLPSLPADPMPRLSSFSGPVNLAHSIIPGRPVIDIEIVGLHQRDPSDFPYDWDVETLDNAILRPLVKSLVPIRRFHMALMPLSGTMLEVICQYFPQLHSLELGFDYRATHKIVMTDEDRQLMTFFGTNGCDPTHPNSYLDEYETRDPDPLKVILKDICYGRAHLPKRLASLRISYLCEAGHQVWTIAEEGTMVLTLSKLYPALQFIAFGIGDSVGIRHWVRNEGDHGGRLQWKPSFASATPI